MADTMKMEINGRKLTGKKTRKGWIWKSDFPELDARHQWSESATGMVADFAAEAFSGCMTITELREHVS